MFGTPLAALDIVLGIAGLDKVLGGITQLDRAMAQAERRRSPQGLQLPAIERSVALARSSAGAWAFASQAVGNHERSLGRLQRALNAPTRDYGAARQAQAAIRAAQDAQRQLERAGARVGIAQGNDAMAKAAVSRSRADVAATEAALTTAKSAYDGLRSAEKALQEQFRASDAAMKREAATLTSLRAKQITDTNRLAAAKRAEQRQADEINERRIRGTSPMLENEFATTVRGQNLYEQQAALAAKGKSTADVDERIRKELVAREAAHQRTLDVMLRQEVRLKDATVRIQGELTATTGALTAQRGRALAAITSNNAIRASLNAAQAASASGAGRVASAQGDVDTARATLMAAQGVRATTRAAVDLALADARRLRVTLGPILKAGGTEAVAQFRAAMTGLSPVEYLRGVMGAAGGVVKTGFEFIGSVGKAGMNVLNGAFAVVSFGANALFAVLRGGVAVVQGIASGLMSLGGVALNAGGMLLKLFASPLIATPLTAGLNLVIDHFGTIIKLIGGATAALLVFAGQQIMQEGVSYQKAESGVRAASLYSPSVLGDADKAEAQMRRLSPLILKIGKDTQYTNTEIAKGVEMLLSGGVAIESVTEKNLRALFNMSAGTDSSIEDTTKVFDALIQLFHVPEDEMEHMANVVTGAVNSSMISMSELGTGMRQLGATAKTLGMTAEESMTALTILANAGFRGETGGTALRNLLLFITPKTDVAKDAMAEKGWYDKATGKNVFFDEKGIMKSFPDMIQIIMKSAKTMTPEQQSEYFETIFGTRSGSVAQIIAGLEPGAWDKTSKRINATDAATVANTRLDNVAGQWEILTGTLQSLASVVFMNWVASPLGAFLKFITGNVNKLYDFATETEGMTKGFTTLFGQQSRLSAFVGLMKQFVTAGSFELNSDFFDGLAEIFAMGNGSRLFEMVPFLQTVQPWLLRFARGVQLGRDAWITFRDALGGNWGGALTQQINPLIRLIGIFGTYWGSVWRGIADFATGKTDLGGFLATLSGAFTRLLGEIGGNIDKEGPGLMERIKGWGTYLKDTGKEWWDKHGRPEFDLLWGGVVAWFEEKKPGLVSLWNNLWSGLLGTPESTATGSMPKFIPGLPGGPPGMGYVPEYKPEKATGPGEIFQAMIDKGKEVLEKNVKPTLDILLNHAREWWGENQPKMQAFGALVGTTIAQGLVDGFKLLMSNNSFDKMIREQLINSGVPGWLIEKMMPVKQDFPKPGGEGEGITGLLGQAQQKWADIFLGDSNRGSGNQTQADVINARKLLPGWGGKGSSSEVEWDDYAGRWVPRKKPGNADLPTMPGNWEPTLMPPPGTMPTAMPRVGDGGAATVVQDQLAALGALVAQMTQNSSQPIQIFMDNKGLTTNEFYAELMALLEARLAALGLISSAGASVGAAAANALGGNR